MRTEQRHEQLNNYSVVTNYSPLNVRGEVLDAAGNTLAYTVIDVPGPRDLHYDLSYQETHERHRGRGLARMLHTRLFGELHQRGVEVVTAYVPKIGVYDFAGGRFQTLWEPPLPVDNKNTGGMRSLWPLSSMRLPDGSMPQVQLTRLRTIHSNNLLFVSAGIQVNLSRQATTGTSPDYIMDVVNNCIAADDIVLGSKLLTIRELRDLN